MHRKESCTSHMRGEDAAKSNWTPRNRGRKVEFTIVPQADKSRTGMKLSRQMRTILMKLEEKDGKGKRKRFGDEVKYCVEAN